jgi:hypothetical protein
MNIAVSDPLELLPYLTGLVANPLKEGAAEASQQLDVRQRAIVIGDPIPIVFCRRVNDNGGVWVSPGATEGRFESNANNDLVASYQLVLSEGQLPQIPLNDLYQSVCKIGTYVQTYNRRAGTWLPGSYLFNLSALVDTVQFSFDAPGTASPTWYNATKNNYGGWDFIYNGQQHYYPGSLTPGPGGPVLQTRRVTADTFIIQDTPVHCGTSGTYAGLTTLSFQYTYSNGNDKWDRQIHAFIRNGIQVTRILDNTLGPSNNIIDLTLYLIRQTSRFPEALIDTTAMTLAANFTNTNSLFYNGEFKNSANLEDWLQEIAPKFLLRVTDKNGKKGFRPLVPINNDYTIKTTAVTWVFGFTEEHILPDGFQIEYIPLSERKPLCALVMWRQQPDDDVGITRTTEVRFTGEATNGPFEQYDLSEFCTVENHAVKVGTYYVARRKYITHSLRIRVRPDAFNSTLVLGDIVRVKLRRETNAGTATFHDYLYEVERIRKDISGVVELDLMHFPVDAQNRSLVALAVSAATGAGYILPSGRANYDCNINTSTTPIADVGGNLGGLPAASSFESNSTAGTEGSIIGGINNPSDIGIAGPTNLGDAKDGDTVSVTPSCPGARLYWYRLPKNSTTWNATEGRILDYSSAQLVSIEENVTGPGSITLTSDDIDYIIYAEYRCPDPSQPDGFGTPVLAGNTNPVEPDTDQYSYARWTGVVIETSDAGSSTNNVTSCWIPMSPGDYLTIGGSGDYSSGIRYEDNGFIRGPALGPVPWRANVQAQQYSNYSFGSQYIGTLGKNENGSVFNNYLCTGIPNALPSVIYYVPPGSANQPFITAYISGRWEFSNDGTTVLLSWAGKT